MNFIEYLQATCRIEESMSLGICSPASTALILFMMQSRPIILRALIVSW